MTDSATFKRRLRATGDFTSTYCINPKCGQLWVFNSGARENFRAVTKLCPDCIGRLPVYGHEVAA